MGGSLIHCELWPPAGQDHWKGWSPPLAPVLSYNPRRTPPARGMCWGTQPAPRAGSQPPRLTVALPPLPLLPAGWLGWALSP